jgi:hypothetical protein
MPSDAFDDWCREHDEFVTEIVEDGAEVVLDEGDVALPSPEEDE